MAEKITGYLLLLIGITIIVLSGYSVYSVFTKQSQPVKLFNFNGISINVGQIVMGNLPADVAQFAPKNQSPQTTEIISPQMLNDSSNIFAHYILMGFIASLGFKLASLGVMLIRPIVVKLRTQPTDLTQPPQ